MNLLPQLGYAGLGFLAGVLLGLLGGGGSVITVPALVYFAGQTPQAAVATSLFIVGTNSVFGAAFHQRRGSLDWKVALVFGGAGMATSFLAARVSKTISAELLMVLFALIMLLIGSLMLFRKNKEPQMQDPVLRSGQKTFWVTLLSGAGVGLLTGTLGVGGGFFIVPALVMLVGMPMSHAVGTSLAIIAANSFAGFLGHAGIHIDVWLTVLFVTAGIAGAFSGTALAHRLDTDTLRRLFAIFVLVLAVFLLVDNLPALLA